MIGERRDIGPVGTVSRAAVGLAAVVVPITSSGIGWWQLAGVAVLALAITAAARPLTGSCERWAPESLTTRHAICSGPACALLAVAVAIMFVLSALTPADGDVVFWVWLGASMLVAAGRGYGGCEVLALPNALTGRRDRIGCILFTPIDTAEAHHRSRRAARPVSSP